MHPQQHQFYNYDWVSSLKGIAIDDNWVESFENSTISDADFHLGTLEKISDKLESLHMIQYINYEEFGNDK